MVGFATTALAWEIRGPEGAPTGQTVEPAAVFRAAPRDGPRCTALTASSDLGFVARETARELREQQALGSALATTGMFADLGVPLERVLDTLDFVATVADEDRGAVHKRLEDPEFVAASFERWAWSSELRLTKYVVWQVEGSPVRTPVHDTALYAPPADDSLRLRYTRMDVYAGAYEAGGPSAGAARSLVWLTREAANEALLQGSVEVRLPDGARRVYNVLLNNGIPYDARQKDPNRQARFWYFHEVDGILGVEQIPLRPLAAVAGDVYNVGLGKLVALEWDGASGRELHLAVLADTGGAFQPNLGQLDWLAGTFPSRAAFEAWERTTPPRVDAAILVRKRP